MIVARIVSTAAPRRPARTRRQFRTYIAATLAAIVVSILASAPTASAVSPAKQCIEIKEDYDLRNAARDSNVFVIIHESDDKVGKEQICKKLESTPSKRLTEAAEKGKGTVFAYMELKDGYEDSDGEWHEGNRNFAKTSLGVKSFPGYAFVSKGMDRNSKFSSHVSLYKGGSDSEMKDVEEFIEKKVGFRLGNDVYNIIFFDTIAARFVSYGDTTGVDKYKQRALSLLVRFSTMFSFREPFTTIGKLYNRAFAMSFEHGIEYCNKQVKKLEKKLEKNSSNLSEDKIHEFQQKIAVLKAFSEPKELTAEDDKQIFIHAALHIGLLVATILLFIVPAEEEPEADAGKEKTEDGEDVIQAEPAPKKEEEETSDKKTD